MKILSILILSLTFASAQAKNFNGKSVKMINLKSGHCLDANIGNAYYRPNIIQHKCHGEKNQIIKIEQVNDSYAKIPLYRLIDESSQLCYDIAGNSYADHANVHLFPCHGGMNQTFQLERHLARTSGLKEEFYKVVASSSNKCLTIGSKISRSMDNIEQLCCSEKLSQYFIIQEAY